jgi:hypothetical protein
LRSCNRPAIRNAAISRYCTRATSTRVCTSTDEAGCSLSAPVIAGAGGRWVAARSWCSHAKKSQRSSPSTRLCIYQGADFVGLPAARAARALAMIAPPPVRAGLQRLATRPISASPAVSRLQTLPRSQGQHMCLPSTTRRATEYSFFYSFTVAAERDMGFSMETRGTHAGRVLTAQLGTLAPHGLMQSTLAAHPQTHLTFAPQKFHHHLLGIRLRERRCLWRERGLLWRRWPCACGCLGRSPRCLAAGVGRGEGVRDGRRHGERMLRLGHTLRRGALRRRRWCEATRRPLRRVARRWRGRCMYRVRTHLGEGRSREQVRLRRRRRAWLRCRCSRARSKGCVGLHDGPLIEQPSARSQRASQPCRRPGSRRGRWRSTQWGGSRPRRLACLLRCNGGAPVVRDRWLAPCCGPLLLWVSSFMRNTPRVGDARMSTRAVDIPGHRLHPWAQTAHLPRRPSTGPRTWTVSHTNMSTNDEPRGLLGLG